MGQAAAGDIHPNRKKTSAQPKNFPPRFLVLFTVTFSAREAQGYIDGLTVGPVSKNHARRVLSTFFAYCERKGFTSGNPIVKTSKEKATGDEIEVFTPGEVRALLTKASEREETDVLACMAIGAFSGLRKSEIDRLTWEDFRWKEQKIELSRAKTKTARRRLVTIQPNLAKWLEPFALKTGRIRRPHYRKRVEGVRTAAEVAFMFLTSFPRHVRGSYETHAQQARIIR